jgi:fructokinase
MENATVLKISDEELSDVSKILFNNEYGYKNIVTEISKTFQNIKFIIITLGEKGSYAYDVHNKTSFSCAAERVTVASTVGAGDSFSAVFLYKYMCGFDIDSCLKSASRISAYVVSKTEAVPEYDPDRL